MAVIRSKRLFVWTVSAAGRITEGELGDEPGPTADAQLYTCPPNTRAILRTWTAVLAGVPPSWDPRPYAHLKIHPAGAPLPFAVWFAYFWDPNLPGDPAIFGHSWNAQVVLNPGDMFTMYNGTRTSLHVHASGAEVPYPGTGSTMET